MIGKTKIELTDINTGDVKVIESENMVTEAYARLVKPRFNPARSFLDADNTGSEAKSSIAATGGVFLFRDTIEENASNYLFPAGAEVTGRGSTLAYASTDTQLGSYNRNESNFEDMGNMLKWVWDFNPSQANGQISCVCLTTEAGGRLGLGSNTMMQQGEGYNTEAIYTAGKFAFPYVDGVNDAWILKLNDEAGEVVYVAYCYNKKTLEICRCDLSAPTLTFFCSRDFKTTTFPSEKTLYSTKTVSLSGYSGDFKACVGDDGYFYFLMDASIGVGARFGLYRMDENGNISTITMTNTTGEALAVNKGRLTTFRVSHGHFCVLGNSKKLWAIKINDNTSVFNFKLTDGTDVTGEAVWTFCGGSELIVNTGTALCYVPDGQNCKSRRQGDPPQAANCFNADKVVRAYVSYVYSGGYKYFLSLYYNPFLLMTINNLAVPVTKTSSQSMRVTYTLLREGYTPPAGD